MSCSFFQAKWYDNSTLSWLTLRIFTKAFWLLLFELSVFFIICICSICIQVNGWVNSHDSEHIVRLVGANQKKYLCWLHLQNLYLIHLFVVFAFRVSGVWVWQLNAGSETTRRTLFGRSVGRSRPKAHQCPRSRPLVLATKIPHLGFLFCHIRSRSSKKRTIGFEYWKIWRKKLLTGCCFLQPAEIW